MLNNITLKLYPYNILFSRIFTLADNAEVRRLIDAGADVNVINKYGGSTILIMASWKNLSEIVKLQLKTGADVNKPQANGLTPLSFAPQSGYTEIVKLSDFARLYLFGQEAFGYNDM